MSAARRRRGSHRLFVAVDPPAAVAAELSSWARAHRDGTGALRPVAPEHVHLTLAFLGERSTHEVEPVAGAMERAVHDWTLAGVRAPIPLQIGPPVWLPPRYPRALAVEVDDPSGTLSELRESLTEALRAAIGWRDQRPRFRPHLTAGRLSGPVEARGPLAPTPSRAFTVGAITVYRSFLRPEGVRYEAVDTVPLT